MQYVIDDEVLRSGYKGVTREVYAFLKAGNVNPGPVKLARLLGYSKRQVIYALLIISGEGAKIAPNGAKNAPISAKIAPQPITETAEKGAKIAPNGAKNAPIDEGDEEGAKNAPNGAKNAPQHKESNTEKNNINNINNNSILSNSKEEKEIPKKETKGSSFRSALLEFGVSDETITQWLSVRRLKRMANTQLALTKAINQLKLVKEKGYSPEDAIQMAVIKSWGGFEAQWYFNEIEKQTRLKPTSNEHRFPNHIPTSLRVPQRRDYASESTL